jgi:hypothetical protein
MTLNVTKEVAAMERMTVDQLRSKFAEVCGEGTNSRHKQWLIKRIAWRMQANAEGGLSERARQRAMELANDADLRVTAPKATTATPTPARVCSRQSRRNGDVRLPLPGTVLTRDYKGETLHVQVLPEGFEYEGEVYKSLSAVAKKITGSHCSGYLFFRLNKQGGDR